MFAGLACFIIGFVVGLTIRLTVNVKKFKAGGKNED